MTRARMPGGKAIISGSQTHARASTICKLKNTLQIVDRQPAPALLPILRSQKVGGIYRRHSGQAGCGCAAQLIYFALKNSGGDRG
jgi:hypothetical protein